MTGILSLNGIWELRDEVLGASIDQADRVAREADGWIPQPVPGDIHQGLETAGRIKAPLLGLNSFDCVWTEHRSWWFRRRFDVEPTWLDADAVELVMQGLDANAEVFLNGTHIGSHPTAFRPFCLDVRQWLRPTDNVLLVRLTSGVEAVSEADTYHCSGIRASTEAANGRPERGDPRRIYARKPQFSWGWDWSPRLATTAIGGDVTLSALHDACIRDVIVEPLRHSDEVLVTVSVDLLHDFASDEGVVNVSLVDETGTVHRAATRAFLRSGLTYVEVRVQVPDPKLWWPNGLGDQHRYRVHTALTTKGRTIAHPEFLVGLRYVELEALDDFAFVINGLRVYAKGANWVPTDAVYARTTDDVYERLVREAREANFNMLRVWGGGLYERDAFYEACDRYGIMLWHDFMFGCAPYPDDLPAFREEVRREADYQTRRLRNHASIVLWCGNNENTWGFVDWWHEQTRGGAAIYNYVLPEIVHHNCPGIPYWTSSPYGGERPNDPDVGDRHHWDLMMNPEMAKRIAPEEYDACDALFVSEFGYVGAPTKETVLTYLDGAPFDREGAVWQHHTNTFEKHTVDEGIRKHYVDPETLSPDDYLLYSGLVQGMMYSYALDSMRYRANCRGSLFWMFGDCWGEVGWTIVDGFRRRKISWYFVKRAYAPIRLILRPQGTDGIGIVVANDAPTAFAADIEVGYVTLDGAQRDARIVTVAAEPLRRTEVVTIDRNGHDPRQGLWYARAVSRDDVPTGIFRACDRGLLGGPAADLRADIVDRGAGWLKARVSSNVYAHAVFIDLPAQAVPSDAYFDLLPGEAREIVIWSESPLAPEQIRVRYERSHRPAP
ncbi:MAG: beta-mannosidase [Anaerolineae bacterium]|nr:beta-mannosidase [Anaerolineae bacterium]